MNTIAVDSETHLSADSDRGTGKKHRRNNVRLALICLAVVTGMVGMAYVAVPLYYIFCSATGYGGTTRVASGNVNGIINREMSVRFDANISRDLDWTVKPAEMVTNRIGTIQTITFLATNNSDHEVTSTASFNVSPELVGSYFNKIQCFCFTEQTLAPGETAEMPVTFFLDPELDKAHELDTLKEVTLSYTFYNAD